MAAPEFSDMLSMFRACVSERADEAAVLYFDTTLTYRQLDDASDTLACWLLDQNVARGDRVSIILQNMPQFLIALLASWKVGAVPVPGNPMYRQSELAKIFADCRPSVVVCLDANASEVHGALGQASIGNTPVAIASPLAFQTRNDARVIPPGAAQPAETSIESILAGPLKRPPQVSLDAEDLGLILYTSGTTGAPKGAMLSHLNLAFNGEAMRDACILNEHSRILTIAPLFHIIGIACNVAAAFSARGALIFHYRVEPSVVLDTIREHRPTFTIGAITAFNALMALPNLTIEDMSSFTRIYSGGAPVPPALRNQIGAAFGQTIYTAYGMTESTAHTHLAPFGAAIPVDPASGALSIGQTMALTEAKIVGEDGKDLPVGQPGQLLMRGPQIMSGYWGMPTESAATLEGGWLHTGDIAFVDENGWFFIVDRLKDMIIASGFKVWPREVEDVLYAHPAVREAAVVGEPDAYRGETVKAYVSLRAGSHVEPPALIEHCRLHLATYKVPRQIEIIDELPKTVSGKIQRVMLRRPA